MAAEFQNIGAGWNNEKGQIKIKIDEAETAGSYDNLYLFPNKFKKSDKHPDWKLTRIVEDSEPRQEPEGEEPPLQDDDDNIPF